jgi:hypothetical protein
MTAKKKKQDELVVAQRLSEAALLKRTKAKKAKQISKNSRNKLYEPNL